MNDERPIGHGSPMADEPPVGDEMRRMLAGMRRRVADGMHDKPRPVSSRRRVGLIVALIAVLGIGTASGSVALGLVPTPFPAAPMPGPTSASPAPSPSGSPSPSAARITPTPTASASATIPDACTDAVPAVDAPRLFGSLVLDQLRPQVAGDMTDYYVDPEEPFTADATLVCHWSPNGSTEDVDNLFLEMGTADSAVLQPRLQALAGKGWTCTDTLGGRSCQHAETTMYYSDRVDTTYTFFVRGDTWISIHQSNIPTDGLLKALVQQTWED